MCSEYFWLSPYQSLNIFVDQVFLNLLEIRPCMDRNKSTGYHPHFQFCFLIFFRLQTQAYFPSFNKGKKWYYNNVNYKIWDWKSIDIIFLAQIAYSDLVTKPESVLMNPQKHLPTSGVRYSLSLPWFMREAAAILSTSKSIRQCSRIAVRRFWSMFGVIPLFTVAYQYRPHMICNKFAPLSLGINIVTFETLA